MENIEQNLIPEARKSQKKKIALVVSVLLIIAGAIYGSWRFVINPKLEPTSSWQIYQNKEYGYELKYPTKWQLWTLGSFEARFYHPDYYLQGPVEGNWFVTTVMVHERANNESWQETAFRTMTMEDQGKIVETSFQGGSAYRLTKCPDKIFKTDNYEFCAESIWFPYSDKNLVFYFSVSRAPYQGEKEKEAVVDIFNQMLSSFRFSR